MKLSWQQKVIGFIICAIIAAIFIVVVRERERWEGRGELREREIGGKEREGEEGRGDGERGRGDEERGRGGEERGKGREKGGKERRRARGF